MRKMVWAKLWASVWLFAFVLVVFGNRAFASHAACGLLVELQARPSPCYGVCMTVLADGSEEPEAVLSSTVATLVVSTRSCMRHGGGWLLFGATV